MRWTAFAAAAAIFCAPRAEAARPPLHALVEARARLSERSSAPRAAGPASFDVAFTVEADEELVSIPECAGRGAVAVDGVSFAAGHGPLTVRVAKGAHRVRLAVAVSGYEGRMSCSGSIVVGPQRLGRDGFHTLDFASPEALGGHAVLYVPKGHDDTTAGPLLVGLHPWNGSMWTYASLGELIEAADADDVPLLFPSGLGNSLYTAPAEREVLRALEAAKATISFDPRRVSLWGASMGGAGATTIGLHHPDAFASVTSFFGDSKYDLSTYVRSLLPTESAAHAVNALDVAENARHVPVWLIHGEADTVSPIAQSELLAQALRGKPGYSVRFDRVPGMGHSALVVARFARALVDVAKAARAPEHPSRVTFHATRQEDDRVYGVRLERARPGDATFDVESSGGTIRLISASNVQAIDLAPGALGAPADAHLDAGTTGVSLRWEAP